MSDLSEIELLKRAHDEFAVARAHAINSYAELELYLALLFQRLLGAEAQKSFAVFASILNPRARLKMISTLLHLSCGDKFDTFFNSLAKKLERIETTRNKIAHWIELTSQTGGKKFNPERDIALHAHPNLFAGGRLYKHEMAYFQKQTRFYGLLLHRFSVIVEHPEALDIGDPDKLSWRDIFSQEVSFPPAENHPLNKHDAD